MKDGIPSEDELGEVMLMGLSLIEASLNEDHPQVAALMNELDLDGAILAVTSASVAILQVFAAETSSDENVLDKLRHVRKVLLNGMNDLAP